MRFEKWQALGNDYVVIERDDLAFELTPARIRRICEPHFGVFSDGVLVLSRPEEKARSGEDRIGEADRAGKDDRAADEAVVARLEIYNPDGSRAELSGNGAREAILYLRTRGWTEADEFSIQTDAGIVRPRITGAETCRVDMGRASLTSKDYLDGPPDGAGEIEAGGQRRRFRHVSIGNPQCAIAVDDLATLEGLDLGAIGPAIEGDARFPNRTNVSFYCELSSAHGGAGPGGAPARIRARIFERGVGETLSSGTGACGAAIAYVLDGGAAGGRVQVEVVLDGGELLVEVGEDLQVDLTGWAKPVFEGRLSELFVKELHETE